jgi:hypothetical protein
MPIARVLCEAGLQKENRRIRRLAIKSEWVVHPFCFDLLDGVCASATQCRRASEICKPTDENFFPFIF